MQKVKELSEVLVIKLQQMYDTEKQQLKSLPKLVKAGAKFPKLVEVLKRHVEETKQQVERLVKAFEYLGLKPKARKSKVTQGLLDEIQEALQMEGEMLPKMCLVLALVRDAETIEIRCYAVALEWAEHLGYSEVVNILKQSLQEEQNTEKSLSEHLWELGVQAIEAARKLETASK